MFCGDCEQFNTSYADKVVSISQVPNEYEFTVESTGSVRPLEILKESIRVLEGKMVEIQRCVRDTMLVDGHWCVCYKQVKSPDLPKGPTACAWKTRQTGRRRLVFKIA